MNLKPRRSSSIDHRPGQMRPLFREKTGPVAIGTGLVALDIVVTDRNGIAPRCWAGGTCFNVLAILAYLGWRVYPVATLGQDAAAQRIFEDLKRFGIRTRFLGRSPTRHTPIVVERIRTRGSRAPRHRFVWTCPNCGAWLPGFQALLASRAQEITRSMPPAAVFFFDRVSRSALELARASAKHGAIVVFEPSGIRDERLFREAVGLSHIVKYSHERLGHLREASITQSPILEIETLGSQGVRYRLRNGARGRARWKEMGAYAVEDLRDTAGAGDWCTAGILHTLGAKGTKGLREATGEQIENALRFGQALAGISCRYEGARGAMYALSKKKLGASVSEILKGESPYCIDEETAEGELGEFLKSICPSCEVSEEVESRTMRM
jgi:sugar/nucleoside kinase (ribokinase family)